MELDAQDRQSQILFPKKEEKLSRIGPGYSPAVDCDVSVARDLSSALWPDLNLNDNNVLAMAVELHTRDQNSIPKRRKIFWHDSHYNSSWPLLMTTGQCNHIITHLILKLVLHWKAWYVAVLSKDFLLIGLSSEIGFHFSIVIVPTELLSFPTRQRLTMKLIP